MKKPRFIAVLLAVALVCISCPFAIAASPQSFAADIQPFWANASRVDPSLTFSGTTANCTAIVSGYSGTTKIVANITLERKNTNGTYTAVKTWANQSTTAQTFTFSNTYTVTKGYIYRLTITADVTCNGSTETVSHWVESSC